MMSGTLTTEAMLESVERHPKQWGLLLLECIGVAVEDAAWLGVREVVDAGSKSHSKRRDVDISGAEAWLQGEEFERWVAMTSGLLGRDLEPEWFRRRFRERREELMRSGPDGRRYCPGDDWRTMHKPKRRRMSRIARGEGMTA